MWPMIEFFLLGLLGVMTIASAFGAIEMMSKKTRRPTPKFEDATMTSFSKNVVIVEFKGKRDE